MIHLLFAIGLPSGPDLLILAILFTPFISGVGLAIFFLQKSKKRRIPPPLPQTETNKHSQD